MIQAKRLPDGTLVQAMPDGTTQPLKDQTDRARLEAMTEEEITTAAESDPDNPPLREEELKRFKPVPDVKAIRQSLSMTQEQFAATFHLSLGTVRDWEQGAHPPDRAARALLAVIA